MPICSTGTGETGFEVGKPNRDWVKFRADSTLEGYGYNALDTTLKPTMAVLAIYCLLAVSPIVHSKYTVKPSRKFIPVKLPLL